MDIVRSLLKDSVHGALFESLFFHAHGSYKKPSTKPKTLLQLPHADLEFADSLSPMITPSTRQ